MTSLAKARRCVYPLPTYQAFFADGTTLRMSVWQYEKAKGWTWDRFRHVLQTSHSGGSKVGPWPGGRLLIDGYLEQDVPGKPWLRLRDPLFSGEEIPKAKRAPSAKATLAVLQALVTWADNGRCPDDLALGKAREFLLAA